MTRIAIFFPSSFLGMCARLPRIAFHFFFVRMHAIWFFPPMGFMCDSLLQLYTTSELKFSDPWHIDCSIV
jgi:hypothetical protein